MDPRNTHLGRAALGAAGRVAATGGQAARILLRASRCWRPPLHPPSTDYPTAATSSPISHLWISTLEASQIRRGPCPVLTLQLACLLTRSGLRAAVVVGGGGGTPRRRKRRGGDGGGRDGRESRRGGETGERGRPPGRSDGLGGGCGPHPV
jgi:hypothetical protein